MVTTIIARRGRYHTEDENSQWKGFGGRKWIVEFLDGTRVETTNLWLDGPAKEDQPDNARILDEAGRESGWVEVGLPGSIYTHAFGVIKTEVPNEDH